MSQIQIVTLDPNDILVVHANVGNLPKQRADEYKAEMKDILREVIPETTRIVVLPKYGIELSILKVQ